MRRFAEFGDRSSHCLYSVGGDTGGHFHEVADLAPLPFPFDGLCTLKVQETRTGIGALASCAAVLPRIALLAPRPRRPTTRS